MPDDGLRTGRNM